MVALFINNPSLEYIEYKVDSMANEVAVKDILIDMNLTRDDNHMIITADEQDKLVILYGRGAEVTDSLVPQIIHSAASMLENSGQQLEWPEAYLNNEPIRLHLM